MTYYVPEGSPATLLKNQEALQEELDHITILAYAFLHVNPNGDILVNGTLEQTRFTYFTLLQNKKHNLKKTISFGGADDKTSFFYALEHPNQFVNSTSAIIENSHLSGIDLDFELNRPFKPDESKRYAELVTKLRQKLGSKKIISITTIIDPETLRSVGRDNWMTIFKHTDFISMMCYDLSSPLYKPAYTEFASNLYPVPNAPKTLRNANLSCEQSIKELHKLGVPLSKIVLGVPAYAVAFGGVSVNNNGLFVPSDPTQTPSFDDMGKGLLRYSTVLTLKDKGFKEYHSSSQGHSNGVWLYNNDKHQFITFDNPETVQEKVNYVLNNKLAGVMLWRVGQDAPINHHDSLLRTIFIHIN